MILPPLLNFDLFCRWGDRMSTVIPDEDVFYKVGFLHSSGFGDWQEFDLQNKEVLRYCEDNGIKVKQYPRITAPKGTGCNNLARNGVLFKRAKLCSI